MRRWIRKMCVLFGIAAFGVACDEPQTTAPSDVGSNDIGNPENPGDQPEDLGEPRLNIDDTTPRSHYWGDRIVSEAFYALSQSRSGGSGQTYNGLAMGDWDYPHSDSYALTRMTNYIGAGNVGPLSLWKDKYRQGGWCKFFANLILYRSSYGYGNDWHLVVPGGGYTYATRSTREAQLGWVLQSATVPHTAVVVAVYGAGLDVVDSNYIGSYRDDKTKQMVYSYALGRHMLSWSELDQKSYKSYCPWVDGYSNSGQGLIRY